jgi:hypothetical protein
MTQFSPYHDLPFFAMPRGFEQARVTVKITSENAADVMAVVARMMDAGVPFYGPDDPPPENTAVYAARAPARRARDARQPTLASVAKQASKAAIAVARYEVKPDGTVVVIPGEPLINDTEMNPWDEVLLNGAGEKRPS